MKEELTGIAKAVREAVLPVVGKEGIGKVVGQGADGAPSYEIDRIAEDAALAAITASGLNVNILSEESSYVDNKSSETLVMDPVDGSRNAINGLPFFSISLAIGSKSLSDVKYGLVMNLITGDTYYAEKGRGASVNDSVLHTRHFDEKHSVFLVYVGTHASANAYDILRKSSMVRSYGSAALEMCLVAAGSADVFYMRAVDTAHSLRIVDIAASTLIVREAGGEVFDITGNVMDMRFDITDRKSLVAVGDRAMRRLTL